MRLPKTIKQYQETFNLDYNSLRTQKQKKVQSKLFYCIYPHQIRAVLLTYARMP